MTPLPLSSARWKELRHAYGAAGDIPALLEQLQDLPEDAPDAEPWFTLWSSLAHQGDVYDASFAAVPHIVAVACSDPANAPASYFHFPAWVEICRAKNGLPVPPDLAESYMAALAKLPELIAAASHKPWDEEFLPVALAALAVAKGQPEIAEAALELSRDTARRFLDWFFSN